MRPQQDIGCTPPDQYGSLSPFEDILNEMLEKLEFSFGVARSLESLIELKPWHVQYYLVELDKKNKNEMLKDK